MKIDSDLEKLEKKIDDNAVKIIENADRIQKNSYALEILNGYKTDNRRLFIILIIVLCMWFSTMSYLIFVLRDMGNVEETTTQEVTDINTINGNVVNKGDVNGESKTNNN